MGKTEKKQKENHKTKVTKIPKNQKTKILDERNINMDANEQNRNI